MPTRANRLLIIGWDAADWRFIEPLIARGLMPTLAALRARGAWGNLSTIQPALSPMLWTSIATGKRPSQHGILGFVEPLTDGVGVRPSASTSRRCRALWNIASENGLRSNVVGWYATHPAEEIDGCVVSNQFDIPTTNNPADWPIPPNSVYPELMARELGQFRVHPAEIDAHAILPFIPHAAEIDQSKDERIVRLRKLIAQTASIHAVTTHLIEHTKWNLTCAYYEGIDRFGHEFMQYHPPAMKGVSARDVELYQEVMVGCYRWHDMMLQRLLELAGEETSVLLISDHGYFHDQRRPRIDADPQTWHRSHGIAVAAGPAIRAGERLWGATLLDVAPTALSILGLPPAQDMSGRVWTELLSHPPTATVPTYEQPDQPQIEGPLTTADFRSDHAAMQQLVDLGYLDASAVAGANAAKQAATLQKYNLAISLVDEGNAARAAQLFDELAAQHPDDLQVLVHRAASFAIANDRDRARSAAQDIAAKSPGHPRSHLILGSLDLQEKRFESAIEHFRAVERVAPDDAGIQCRLGQVYLLSREIDSAKKCFARAIELDADLAIAHDGLSETALLARDYAAAQEHALDAISLTYFLPRAHLHLAESLRAQDKIDEAVVAAKNALRLAPTFIAAKELLVALYEQSNQLELAMMLRRNP